MELVSIIYSSLLVVFSLLGLVLLASYIYSKMFVTDHGLVKSRIVQGEYDNSKQVPKKVKKKKEPLLNERLLTSKEKEQIAHRAALSISRIEQKLIVDKKVRVVRSSENSRRERMKSDYVNSVSRYSVVNSFARESSSFSNSNPLSRSPRIT